MKKRAKAKVDPIRQRTQYTCVATSILMALRALGKDLNEDQVNRILGAEPKKGARWEEALATIQYFGCRGTLTAPSTLGQIKDWTDKGLPVLIAWNPEGRPWSHASVVFHVEQGPPETWAEDVGDDAQIQGSGEGMYVWVADPNIPNPSKMYRIVHEQEFYEKWGEDWGDFIVRRPALVVSVEVDAGGRQVMASDKTARVVVNNRLADVPPEMEAMASKMLAAHTRAAPILRRFTKHIAVTAFTDSNYHINIIAPGWSTLIDEDQPDYDPALAMEFGRQSKKGKAVMTDIAKRHGYKPTGRGMWLSDGKHNIILGMAGGRTSSVMASDKSGGRKGKRPQRVNQPKDPREKYRVRGKAPKDRNEIAEALAANRGQGNPGPHHNRSKDVAKGRSRKPKHRGKSDWKQAETAVANTEVQSSFYKRLEGEPLQVTPLRTMPDYGERDFNEERTMMDLKDMLAELTDSTKNTKKKANTRPAGGLYGYTKSTQRDVLASVRKVQKSANRIAKTIYAKDKNTFNFLHLHAERSNSLSARILCAAMENIGPKVASTKTAAGHGMYGYRVKTAKLALQACLDISQEAGSVAYDLHTRRTAKYAKITSFLKDHSKRGRCRYARILLRFYPDAPVVTASEDADEKEAKHEKGKSVALKDMPKEMQENAKDPSKHIKPKKKKKASEIEDLNMQVLAALEADGVDEDEKLALLEKAKKVYNTLTNSQKSAGGCDNLPNEAMVENCKKKQEEAKDSKEAEDDSDKTAGCEKLPNEAMQKACEDKKKEGEENSDDDGDKKASRVRLTTRVAMGEIQRGLIRFAADEEDGEEDDEKSADNMGRSQLPGESDGNQVQPKLEGNSGYNPGSTELNGDSGAPKAAADAAELAAKAEGSTTLPGDDESDKIQPDMNTHGYEVGHAVKTKKSSDSETWATTSLPDGATLIWVE